MAYTQAQLDALEEAIAEGVLEVKYDGRETRYRSLDEMERIRNNMRTALGLAGAKPSRKIGVYHKGL